MHSQTYFSNLMSTNGPPFFREHERRPLDYPPSYANDYTELEMEDGLGIDRTPPPPKPWTSKLDAPMYGKNLNHGRPSSSTPHKSNYPLNPFVPSNDRFENTLTLPLDGFDLADPNRFFQPSPPRTSSHRLIPKKNEKISCSSNRSNQNALILYSNKPRHPEGSFIDENNLEDPVETLFRLCSQRKLPKPEFYAKTILVSKTTPTCLYGMEVVVNRIRQSTSIQYSCLKDAEVAAAFLGLHLLGIPVPLHPPSRKTDSPSSYSSRPPLTYSQTTIDRMEPNLGTMGNTYFQAFQRLLHRHHMLMPTFSHEALSTFPPRHSIVFEFYGQRFEAIDAKKTNAKQLVCKRAYEYFSKHPAFLKPPIDYRLKLSHFARSKKWHCPKFFDPSNGRMTFGTGVGEMGVIIHEFQFIEKWNSELSSTGAKQLVAKKAYEALMQMESERTLPNVTKRLPLPCSVSQVNPVSKMESSSPFMKSRFTSSHSSSVRNNPSQTNDPNYYATFRRIRRTSPSTIRFEDLGSSMYPYYDSNSEREEEDEDPTISYEVSQAHDENDPYYLNMIHPDFEEDGPYQEEGEMEGYQEEDSYPNEGYREERYYPTYNESSSSRYSMTLKKNTSPPYYDEVDFITSHYDY